MSPGQPFKACPACGAGQPLEVSTCTRCGHTFRQTFVPGPPPPSPNPTQAFYGAPRAASPANVDPNMLAEMARRFNDSRKTFIWTFFIGLLCLWPVWIVTYIEYTKMRDIKNQIGTMGLNVPQWQMTYGARDPF